MSESTNEIQTAFPTLDDLQKEVATQSRELPRLQRTTMIAYVAAVMAGVLYAIFIFNPHNAGQRIPYVMLILAEIILLSNAGVMIMTILAGDKSSELPAVEEARRKLLQGAWMPTVDVLIPVYGEPLEVIRITATAARDMSLAHRTIICDDARDPKVAEMAASIGVEYRTRPDNVNAKAGNVNAALAATTADYVTILDADHVPVRAFLERTLAHFVDPRVAFVQSPQSYRNRDASPVASASHESQRVFYDLVCPGKNAYNSVFSVGTNVVYRRHALAEVNGLYGETNSEDIWTSLRLHQLGWASVFVPEILAEGLAPEDVATYLQQQYRWSRGAFEILLHARPWRMKGLTRDQRIQYIQPGLHYLQSVAMLFFMLLPALFLVFYVQPLRVNGVGWLLRYAPFWVLTQLAIYYQVGRLHVWSYCMAIASVPVHIRAFFTALFRRKYGWRVTNREGRVPSVLESMPTQLLMVLGLLTAFMIGLFPLRSTVPTTISLVLCLVYALSLLVVIRKATSEWWRSLRHKNKTPRVSTREAVPA
jgi:cellulose synthase (UDP-forming)